MVLSNAERQRRHRQRVKAKLEAVSESAFRVSTRDPAKMMPDERIAELKALEKELEKSPVMRRIRALSHQSHVEMMAASRQWADWHRRFHSAVLAEAKRRKITVKALAKLTGDDAARIEREPSGPMYSTKEIEALRRALPGLSI